MKFVFSQHALDQIKIRGISKETVLAIVFEPDSIVDEDETIRIYSKLVNNDSKIYLYRVFVNYLKQPCIIITVYKTSKIKKYGN